MLTEKELDTLIKMLEGVTEASKLLRHLGLSLKEEKILLKKLRELREGEKCKVARNGKFIFGIKSQEECISGDWDLGSAIAIVHKDFWKKQHCMKDSHISDEMDLPPEFGEEGESLFSYNGDEDIKGIIKILVKAGLEHSEELQEWFKRHAD